MPKKKKIVKKVKAAKRKVKSAKKRTVSKKIKIKKVKTLVDSMVKVAEITHYFPHVKAAAMLVLKDSIKIGDEIYIKGHTTDFKEKVNSLQLDLVAIEAGKKGQEVGLLVKSRVRIGDSVYRI